MQGQYFTVDDKAEEGRQGGGEDDAVQETGMVGRHNTAAGRQGIQPGAGQAHAQQGEQSARRQAGRLTPRPQTRQQYDNQAAAQGEQSAHAPGIYAVNKTAKAVSG